MSEKILITGGSGDGKSYSLRNLPPEETLFVKPTNKMTIPIRGANKIFIPLSKDGTTGNTVVLDVPFKTNEQGENVSRINGIYAIAKKRKFKYLVIDDVQYILLAIENMFKLSDTYKDQRRIYAYIKQFTYNILTLSDMEASSITTIFSWQKLSTKDELVIPGEAFNEVVVPQGFFNIVLQCEKGLTGEHSFRTNGNGLCKSPYGMLDEVMPNDIMPVLKAMEEYYE